MTPDERPRRRSKVRLAVIGVLLTLVALEVSLRVFDVVRGRSWNARTSWHWLFARDSYLGHRGRADIEIRYGSSTLRHNRDGFRDARDLREIARVPEHRLILCVGDSSTYGSDVPDPRQAYPARLEAHLRESTQDERWLVFNAGVPGYTSREATQLLALKLLKYRPAAVLMMSLNEDERVVAKRLNETTDYADLARSVTPEPETWLYDLCMRSALFGWFASRAHASHLDDWRAQEEARERSEPTITPKGRAFYLDNLALAALLCRRAGVPLLMVDQPVVGDRRTEAQRRATSDLRDALGRACVEHGLQLLQADAPLREQGFRCESDVHLGVDGYDRLAKLLAPQVRSALPLEGK